MVTRADSNNPEREGERNFASSLSGPDAGGVARLCTVPETTRLSRSSIQPAEAEVPNRATLEPADLAHRASRRCYGR